MQQHQQAVSVLFAGNSEMAKVMRSQTWSQTAVGAIEHWSLTLQTAIRILLSACQPMVCVWGSKRTLFYNDAWVDLWLPEPPSLAVGQSLSQLPAPWNTLVAAVEQVWQTGQPLTSEVASDRTPGQCLGTAIACSYSPLWDELGQVAGVFVSGCPVVAERSPRSSRTAAPQSEMRGPHPTADLQLVTDALPVLIALIDRQERYRFANRTYETWFGLSPEAVCQRTICEVVGVAAYQMIRPYIRQALAGATVRFEQEVPFHQGGSRYVEVTYVPHREASGTVSGFVALISDISDRKRTENARAQAETALRESENRFRRMADFSPIMIWISDPTGAGTWFNQQWYDFTGQTVEAALGDGWLAALHPEDAARIHESCAAANQQRASVRLEYRLRRWDGEYRWVLDVAMPRFDGVGNYLGYIGSIVDIHDRKQAEAEREQLLLELASERARLETVLRQLPAGVMIADAASEQLLLTNEQTRQMLRYDYEVGATLPTYHPLEPFQAFRLTGEPYTADEYPLARSLRTGEVISHEAMVIRFPDHSQIVIEVNASPIFNSQGHITAAVSIFQDVTARQQAEAALRQSEEQARLAIQVGRLGTWRYDLRQDRVQLDQRMREIWGEAAAVALPLATVIQRIHPADREPVRQAVERALSPHSDGTYEADYRIRWDDGTVRWISANGQVQFEGEGAGRRPVDFFGTVLDITDRKQAEAALREQEQRYRYIFEAVNVPIWEEDFTQVKAAIDQLKVAGVQDFRQYFVDHPEFVAAAVNWVQVHDVNQAALRMFEAQDKAELLSSLERTFVPATWAIFEAELLAIAAEEPFFAAETTVQTLQGRQLNVFVAIAFPQHGAYHRVLVSLLDITPHKQSEAALQAAEERLRVALKNAPITVFNQDRDLRYTWIHKPALYRPEAVLGRQDQDLLSPTDAAVVTAIKQHALSTATSVRHEVKVTHAGLDHYFDLTVEPLRDATGVIIGITGATVDISTQKHTELRLRESEERLRLAMEAAQMATWDVDLKTGKAIWSDRHFEMLGYEPTANGEASEAMWNARIHPEDRDRVLQEWQQAQIEHRFYRAEYRVVRAGTGAICWLEGLGNFRYDARDQAVRSIGVVFDINDRKREEAVRKQVETALREQRAILAAILRQAADAIIVCNATGQLTFVNGEARRLAQLDPEGTTLDIDFLAWGQGYDSEGNLIPVEEYSLTRALRGETSNAQEFRMVRQDGSYYDILISAAPLWSESRQIMGAVANFMDISDRKRAEAALQESEDRLRMAIESAQLGVWDWNLVTHELTWDAGCKAMFGLPPEAPTNLDIFFNALHPEDRERMMQVVQESLNPANGGHYDAEYRVIGIEDGMERWILAKGQVYFDGDREARRFTGTVLDITEQKRFEQALMDSEVRARARAEELTAIMETTPAAIWIAHDPDCHEMTANKTAYELMGMLPGTATTATAIDGSNPLPFRQCREGQDIPPQDLPMQQAARLRQPVMGDLEFVFPDGTTRYLYGKAVPLYGPDGDVRGTIGGFVDITALKLSERAREQLLQRERQARAEAEKASRIKDEFLAILSHELRSPLNPILGWSTLLRSGRLDAEKTAIALETIERNAKLQIQLIDDLLDISRIIRGKLNLNMAPTPLENTIAAAIETVRLAAEAKSIRIHRHLDPECQVLGDAARLQQIVWNLLSNAVKFTPEGGQVDIYLAPVTEPLPSPQETALPQADPALTATVARYAQIQVRDTGKGIHADFLPHVFEHFRQADSTTTRNFGGLGLGLAIVRYLVELHGGTVQADSPGAGQGAVFTVRLPRLKDRPPEMPAAERPLRSDTEPLPLQHLQILLVDDDPDTRDFLELTLEQQGAVVTAVASAPEALKACQRTPFDLLISDIGMPNMDGYTLMRHIRHQAAATGGHLPAIALTAYAGEANQRQALAAGFDCHIAKPVDLDRLIPTIVDLIQGRA